MGSHGGDAQPLYLLSCQSHHVQGPVHEPSHQDLGAVFGGNHVVGPVVGSDVLQDRNQLSFCIRAWSLPFHSIALRTGGRDMASMPSYQPPLELPRHFYKRKTDPKALMLSPTSTGVPGDEHPLLSVVPTALRNQQSSQPGILLAA